MTLCPGLSGLSLCIICYHIIFSKPSCHSQKSIKSSFKGQLKSRSCLLSRRAFYVFPFSQLREGNQFKLFLLTALAAAVAVRLLQFSLIKNVHNNNNRWNGLDLDNCEKWFRARYQLETNHYCRLLLALNTSAGDYIIMLLTIIDWSSEPFNTRETQYMIGTRH